MTPQEVVEFFGTQVAAATALGIKQSSISEWVVKGEIPETRQYQIELATAGALRADLPALRASSKQLDEREYPAQHESQ